jgi:hypothetical protein
MNLKALVAISLALNAALAVAYFTRSAPAPAPAPATASSSAPAKPAAPKEKKVVVTQVVTNETVKKIDWRMVESDDYKKYIANLRAIGCPEETIKDIIMADINKLFEQRKKDLKKEGEGFKFWKTGQPLLAGMSEEKMKQQKELADEKRALLKELLGTDASETQNPMASLYNPLGDMLDFLSSDKQAKALEMIQEVNAKALNLVSKAGGQPGDADMAKIKSLVEDYEAGLKKMLSPQEKELYDLSVSQTAMQMRMQLGAFDPNEKEFRDIFALRKKHDDEYQFYGNTSDSALRDRRDGSALETDAEVRKLLGEARWNDYRDSTQWRPNSPLRQVAEEYNVPKEQATKVFDIRDAAKAEAIKLRGDTSLSPDRLQTELRRVQDQTRVAVAGALGEKAAGPYFEKPGAKTWIDDLTRVPKPKP